MRKRLRRASRASKLTPAVKPQQSAASENAGMPKRNGLGIALLADPTRRQIIALLAQHPWRPKTLAKELNLSFPAVSRQLDLLLKAGLVTRQSTIADGRGALYFLEDRALPKIVAWLAGTEVGIEQLGRGSRSDGGDDNMGVSLQLYWTKDDEAAPI
jgi:DNA-binding transcriptional ArsR family regulator